MQTLKSYTASRMGTISYPSARSTNSSHDDPHQLVQRILESPEFRRAPRLKALLTYICDRRLEQPAAEIREQELGARIFGRPENYSTSEDPIVRVQVSHLRKKLKQYFENEGKEEALIVDIPRGMYLPVFSPRTEEPEKIESNIPRAVLLRRRLVIWAAVVLVCFIGTVTLIRMTNVLKAEAAGSVFAKFWANLIQPGQRTTIVVADSCLTFAQDITHRPITLQEYLAHDPKTWFGDAKILPAEARDLELLMTRQYASIADINDIRRILLANPRHQEQVNVVFARDFNIRSIGSDNLILLGSRRSNPWVELFNNRLNFKFGFDEQSMKAFIKNNSPLPGEQSFYRISGSGVNITEGYADIAFLPSADGSRKVLLLQGTDMEATEAAGDIVASEHDLGTLLSRVSRNKSTVPFFEALYKTHRLAGAPRQAELLAVRRIRL